MSRTFEGALEAGPGGGALVRLPPEVVASLGGTRVRVRGTLNGVDFRSSTMPTGGGAACLGVHKATREAAGAAFGDRVQVAVELDQSPREVELPPELAQALAADPALRSAFEGLAFTHRREQAEWIGAAKRPETRARRLGETLERLRTLDSKRG
jgi:bacteriocin resistance YdeI/OmpD-like protein/uncharacterized protein DUF1905